MLAVAQLDDGLGVRWEDGCLEEKEVFAAGK